MTKNNGVRDPYPLNTEAEHILFFFLVVFDCNILIYNEFEQLKQKYIIRSLYFPTETILGKGFVNSTFMQSQLI